MTPTPCKTATEQYNTAPVEMCKRATPDHHVPYTGQDATPLAVYALVAVLVIVVGLALRARFRP